MKDNEIISQLFDEVLPSDEEKGLVIVKFGRPGFAKPDCTDAAETGNSVEIAGNIASLTVAEDGFRCAVRLDEAVRYSRRP